MRLKKSLFIELFVIVVVALCLGGIGQKVFAQEALPAEGYCEEFQELRTPFSVKCYKMYYIPFVIFGCGENGDCFSSILKGANVSNEKVTENVQFSWAIYPMSPFASDGHYINLTSIFTDNKVKPLGDLRLGFSGGLWLLPEASAELKLLYTQGGCDQYGDYCPTELNPDMTKVSMGNAIIGYLAGGPTALRGLPRPSVEIIFKSKNGLSRDVRLRSRTRALPLITDNSSWQTSEVSKEPEAVWRTAVRATKDNVNNLFLVVGNPYDSAVTVEGKLINQDGLVLSTQTWNLVGDSAKTLYITDSRDKDIPGFGREEVFNTTIDGVETDFTGWLELRVVTPEEGKFVPMTLQTNGKAMYSTNIQPFQK